MRTVPSNPPWWTRFTNSTRRTVSGVARTKSFSSRRPLLVRRRLSSSKSRSDSGAKLQRYKTRVRLTSNTSTKLCFLFLEPPRNSLLGRLPRRSLFCSSYKASQTNRPAHRPTAQEQWKGATIGGQRQKKNETLSCLLSRHSGERLPRYCGSCSISRLLPAWKSHQRHSRYRGKSTPHSWPQFERSARPARAFWQSSKAGWCFPSPCLPSWQKEPG